MTWIYTSKNTDPTLKYLAAKLLAKLLSKVRSTALFAMYKPLLEASAT